MTQLSNRISNRIQDAWKLRPHRTEECLAATTALKRELGIPFGKIDLQQIRELGKTNDPLIIAEVLLLGASLARARGDVVGSKFLIENIERFLSEIGHQQNYHLLYEKGITSFLYGDHSVALEQFLAAHSVAGDLLEKVDSLVSAVFCMENLGLPFESTFERVKQLQKQLAEQSQYENGDDLHSAKLETAVIARQLDGVELRAAFRRGDLKTAFDLGFKDLTNIRGAGWQFDQVTFSAMLFSQLPFHRYHKRMNAEMERLTFSSQYFPQKAYRVRTLQGFLHPEDLYNVQPTGFVDRLYLWVWRWLEDPEAFPIQRILALIDRVGMLDSVHRLTAEDSQMLRNSLRWLGLFDPNSEVLMQRLLSQIKHPAHSDYPIFEIENLVIHYLMSLSSHRPDLSKNYLLALSNHELWNSPDLHFKGLIEAVNGAEPKALEKMVKNLRSLLFSGEIGAATQIVVDMSRFQITNVQENKNVVSEAMCLGLEILSRKNSVSCDEFVAYCFGISRFDPLIHNARIFNLLSRLRAACGENFVFTTKQGFVFLEGDLSKFKILRRHTLVELLGQQPEWKNLLYARAEQDEDRGILKAGVLDHMPEIVPTPRVVKNIMKRREIEKLLQKSRSTANRILAHWEKEGLVSREGSARSTRYRLSPSLRQSLETGDLNMGQILE